MRRQSALCGSQHCASNGRHGSGWHARYATDLVELLDGFNVVCDLRPVCVNQRFLNQTPTRESKRGAHANAHGRGTHARVSCVAAEGEQQQWQSGCTKHSEVTRHTAPPSAQVCGGGSSSSSSGPYHLLQREKLELGVVLLQQREERPAGGEACAGHYDREALACGQPESRHGC